MSGFQLPHALVDAASRESDDGRQSWLMRLPGIVARIAERWTLTVKDPYQPGGQTAWVAPAHAPGIGAVALKVAWRHPEALHEADGLRAWAGGPVVRVHRAEVVDGQTSALLIERCEPGTSLMASTHADQDVIVAAMLRKLWITPPADHPFRALQEMCDEWADEFHQKIRARAPLLDPAIARLGIELFTSLPRTATRKVLLCTDLHAENILAAEREPWLLVDPKPYVGDPTYDPLQHMLNCPQRLRQDPLGLIACLADLLDLDNERLRLWLFARCVQESPDHPDLAEIAGRIAPT